MRLLHVTDSHLGMDRWFRGAPPGWRRSADHLAALRAAFEPALRGEMDLVVHTGDLFDRSRPPARAVAEATALFAEVGRVVPLVVLPGNHDRRGLFGHLGTPPAGVTVCDEAGAVTIAGVRLGVVPYLPTAAAWAEAARSACAGGVDLLLAHQSFHGARVPGFVFRVGAQRETVGEAHLPAGVTRILCGHIHPRQVVRLGGATVVHPGSTERTSFTERHQTKGTAVWDLAADTWAFADLPSRPMYVVRAETELAAVSEEALVRLEGAARTVDVERTALARGAWVEPWTPPTAQLRLF